MADWTTLSNQAVGVGGLPSGTTVTALRDNPIAIAEGAPGAPRINLFAINDVVAGGSYRVENLTLARTPESSSAFITAKLIKSFYQAGTVRVYFEHRSTFAGNISTARILIDSVEVASFSTSSDAFQARQFDATVSIGSRIEIQHRIDVTSSTRFSEVRNARLGDDGLKPIWPFDYGGWGAA